MGMNYIYALITWLSVVGIYQSSKPLPEGIDYRGKIYTISSKNIEFLTDLTYIDSSGNTIHAQEIFDTLFMYVDAAKYYMLFDMFLFNSYEGPDAYFYRELSQELATKLIEKKGNNPSIEIDFITDPVNTFYGGAKVKELDLMKAAGVNIIMTDLTKLRDSTLPYSPFWRTFIQWFGNSSKYGFLPHPFSSRQPGVTARSYWAFLNFKANHRKIFIADHHGEMVSLVTSANPHSASSAFSNVAFLIRGDFWKDIYSTEKLIAQLSGGDLGGESLFSRNDIAQESSGDIEVQLITEVEIQKELLASIGELRTGDTVSIAMFYLSSRVIIKALLGAVAQGVEIKIILDPNKDAFGYFRNGVPNQSSANELMVKSKGKIKIRWYHTHGEQFHSKLVMINRANGKSKILLGSSNITRKNLESYNLELDIIITADSSAELVMEVKAYFHRIWNNVKGYYTADYETFADNSILKTLQYRIQENTGLSSY